MPIHPTAIVDASAQIHESADHRALLHHRRGCRKSAPEPNSKPAWFWKVRSKSAKTTFSFPIRTVGVAPQDLKYHGERSRTRIGNRNKIREFVTIHRGTEGGGMLTSIGDDNLLMAYVHVAHDVQLGQPLRARQRRYLWRPRDRRRLGRHRRIHRRPPVLPHRPPRHDRRL